MAKKTRKRKGTVQTFKEIIAKHFKSHGISSPTIHLARQGGVSLAHMYLLYKWADNGIGIGNKRDTEKPLLDPKTACWLIMEADDVLRSDEVIHPTPIDEFLRPLLEKFRKEQRLIQFGD